MSDESLTDEKRIRLRYAGACRECGADLPARAEAIYDKSTKTVRCLTHVEPAEPAEPEIDVPEPEETIPIDVGTPGASARREFERRKASREQRVRAKHPKIGGLLLALSDEPQTTNAWNTGAIGEERLGDRLNQLAAEQLRVLHDRRIPGSRANIDHLAVTPSGIYVIDAKRYKGRPRLKVEGGVLRPRTEKLLVGTRDCTKIVYGVIKQMNVVNDVIGDFPIHGVLCFVEADWPLIGGSFSTQGVSVLWPKKLYPLLKADGYLTSEGVCEVHQRLAAALPPA